MGISVRAISVGAVGAAIGLGLADSAQAYSAFGDRATWEAAVEDAIITTDPFDNSMASQSELQLDSGITSLGIGGSTANMVASGYFEGVVDKESVATGGYFQEIRWIFPNPVIAFGGDWWQTVTSSGLSATIQFLDSEERLISFKEEMGWGGNGFFGIVADKPFEAIIFRDEELRVGAEGWRVDNFSFAMPVPLSGPDDAATVPEPLGVLGLVALGGVAVLGRSKRRNGELG